MSKRPNKAPEPTTMAVTSPAAAGAAPATVVAHLGRSAKLIKSTLMRDLIQSTVDSVAKWGPWLCTLLIAGSLAGLLRLWRNNRSLQARARTSLLFKSSWFSRLVVAGIGLWLLKVQLAPLTTSLTTLRSGRGEQIRAFSFRHVSNDQLQ